MATLRNRNGKWHVQVRRSGHSSSPASLRREAARASAVRNCVYATGRSPGDGLTKVAVCQRRRPNILTAHGFRPRVHHECTIGVGPTKVKQFDPTFIGQLLQSNS